MSASRLAIGVGARPGVAAASVVAAVRTASDGLVGAPVGLFTLDRRAGEPGLREAGASLGLDVAGLSPDVLAARAADCVTRSARAEAAAGVPSVAEAAALAGAGPGSKLVRPRIVHDGVTVAVAGASA